MKLLKFANILLRASVKKTAAYDLDTIKKVFTTLVSKVNPGATFNIDPNPGLEPIVQIYTNLDARSVFPLYAKLEAAAKAQQAGSDSFNVYNYVQVRMYDKSKQYVPEKQTVEKNMTVDFIKKVIQSFDGVGPVEPTIKIEEDAHTGTRNLNVLFVTNLDKTKADMLNKAIIVKFKAGINQNTPGYKHFKYFILNLTQFCKDKGKATASVDLSTL